MLFFSPSYRRFVLKSWRKEHLIVEVGVPVQHHPGLLSTGLPLSRAYLQRMEMTGSLRILYRAVPPPRPMFDSSSIRVSVFVCSCMQYVMHECVGLCIF